MKRVWSDSNLSAEARQATLTSDEWNHLVRVLRTRPGEVIEVINGKGEARTFTLTDVADVRRDTTILLDAAPLNVDARSRTLPMIFRVSLFKDSRWETLIEKVTELGVERIEPVVSEFSVVRIEKSQIQKKLDRWSSVVRAACKQSGRLRALEIAEPRPLAEYIKERASETEVYLDPQATTSLASVFCSQDRAPAIVWIGPEGGWSTNERALLGARAQAASLGPLILRAETAAIAVASYLRFARL